MEGTTWKSQPRKLRGWSSSRSSRDGGASRAPSALWGSSVCARGWATGGSRLLCWAPGGLPPSEGSPWALGGIAVPEALPSGSVYPSTGTNFWQLAAESEQLAAESEVLACEQATVWPKLASTRMATEDGRAERLLNLPQPVRVGLGPAPAQLGARPCPQGGLSAALRRPRHPGFLRGWEPGHAAHYIIPIF